MIVDLSEMDHEVLLEHAKKVTLQRDTVLAAARRALRRSRHGDDTGMDLLREVVRKIDGENMAVLR